jgi:hypothetical protein
MIYEVIKSMYAYNVKVVEWCCGDGGLRMMCTEYGRILLLGYQGSSATINCRKSAILVKKERWSHVNGWFCEAKEQRTVPVPSIPTTSTSETLYVGGVCVQYFLLLLLEVLGRLPYTVLPNRDGSENARRPKAKTFPSRNRLARH